MNLIDYTVLALLAGGALAGFSNGLVRQMISLISFSAGFVIASQHYTDIAPFLSFIGDSNWVNIVSFAIITIAIAGAGSVVGESLHRVVGLMMFGCFDRLLGAAFGAFLTLLIIEVALIVLTKFSILTFDKHRSVVVGKLLDFSPLLLNLLPPEFDAVRKALS
ncbi:MAG: CvpA family protein [Chloroflexi bacterium]|nr:CvpA family protein [Chloroflexota bacterium]MDA8187008.1 CvpA family protein [Dehalococcoidales bacterium]